MVNTHNVTLITTPLGNGRVFDCIGWQDPTGGMNARAFVLAGHDDIAIPAARITETRRIGTGTILSLRTETPADHIVLTDGARFAVTAPQPEIFAGLNCCIAERNGETVETLADWVRYHVANFALDALLLLDRAQPDRRDDLRHLCRDTGLKRLVHVLCDTPLGAANAPQASHPIHSPDAPGKDRMKIPAPDPWRAPLALAHLYEWARLRYLSRARAVMNLDLTDLLCPGANPFDTVQTSQSGVLHLRGQRIYPWRIRAKHIVGFGDHICRQFDNPRANNRWCISPDRLAPDNIWRLVRITATPPDPAHSKGFWRAMGIRHPGIDVADIVPKTALVEDPELLALARETFDHKPVRPPQSKLRHAPGNAIDGGRTCIVSCMKNEGPFILEWIAYHRAIGVEDFLIYSNDCTDGTDALLDLLQERGLIQHRDNPFKGTDLRPQHAALQAAEQERIVQKSGWTISMDVDEFINIHVGQGRLKDLYKAIGAANMISLTWRLFGNGDVDGFADRFVTDQFTRCAPELCRKPHQAWGFKTLFRNIGIYKKMGVHRPKGLKPDLWDQITWVNGSGKPMPRKLLRNGWRSTAESYGYNLVTLNHYAVRSVESFLVKRDRGRVNHVDRDQGESYWFRMNNNWQEDRSIQGKRGLLAAEFDRLMADPRIAAAHAKCVAAHRSRITQLRADPGNEALYQRLSGARMKRLSRLHTHFGANVFLAGPEVVPDEVALADHIATDFFFTVPRMKTTH